MENDEAVTFEDITVTNRALTATLAIPSGYLGEPDSTDYAEMQARVAEYWSQKMAVTVSKTLMGLMSGIDWANESELIEQEMAEAPPVETPLYSSLDCRTGAARFRGLILD